MLYDDRDERAGAKFADMDLIGLPWQLTSGRAASRPASSSSRNAARRARGDRNDPPEDRALNRLARASADEDTDAHDLQSFERMVAPGAICARAAKEGVISVIAGFSLLGIALGVATLIIVMAVMNGFRTELARGRIPRRQRPLTGLRRADVADRRTTTNG